MLDSRFERDTLFLIFEEDFRFEPEETSGSTNLEPVAGQNSGAPGVGNWYEFPLGPRTPNKMLKPSQEPVRHPPGLGWNAVCARAPSARAPAQPNRPHRGPLRGRSAADERASGARQRRREKTQLAGLRACCVQAWHVRSSAMLSLPGGPPSHAQQGFH